MWWSGSHSCRKSLCVNGISQGIDLILEATYCSNVYLQVPDVLQTTWYVNQGPRIGARVVDDKACYLFHLVHVLSVELAADHQSIRDGSVLRAEDQILVLTYCHIVHDGILIDEYPDLGREVEERRP